jgi:RNA polymerase sigma-70 factor (ECF subfamily)
MTAPKLPEARLLELARKGNSRAFQELIAPFVGGIRRITTAFCSARAEADDLAQDALLKAYRSLQGPSEIKNLEAWLYSVTRSVCHDAYRQRLSRGRDGEVEFDERRDGQELQQRDPDQLLEAKSDAERLWCAIRSLEPTFRIPLVLFDIEGLAYEQVARIEGVPVGTVRSRLSRARQRLAQILSQSEASGTFSAAVPSAHLSLAK